MRGKVFWRKLKGDFASGSVAFCDSSGIIPIGRFKTPSEIMKGIFLVSGVVGASGPADVDSARDGRSTRASGGMSSGW